MVIGVIADSHDHLDRLRLACAIWQTEKVQAVIHAGDYVAPFTLPILAQLGVPLYGVRGNNDGELAGLAAGFAHAGGHFSAHPQEILLDNKRILIQHEPFALDTLHKTSDSALSLVVYGHTHRAEFRPSTNGGPAILNPGEACGWLYNTPTIAVYDTLKSVAHIITLPG